jgi:tetratricopeptide (TPR) repeat protein
VQSKSLWHQQVQQAMAEGAIEQAEAILKQWLGAAPSDPLPRIWLARIYIKNGFYLAAEPLLTNLSGSDAKALLGLIYERSDRPTLAAKLFEALYQVNPENGRWLLFWAVNSENSGQLAKSRSLYQTYLTLFELEDPALTQFSQQRLTTLGGY